jgi:hypothetical protein
VGSFFWAKHFIAYNWKNHYTEAEMKAFGSAINNSTSLHKDFYSAYELVHPGQVKQTISEMQNMVLWNFLTLDNDSFRNSEQCHCVIIAEKFENRFPPKYYSLSWLMLAHGLEQHSSELKCLDFWYFSNSFMQKLSVEHFGKTLYELSFEESVEFLTLEKSPTRYLKDTNSLKLQVKNYLKNTKR